MRGRLAPHVPYRLGHFVAVPCAARRPAVPNGASQWGSRWVVPHLRRPPRIPAASWLWVDASRIRPGLLARGRRGMGSVGGWPLAKPTTQHLGVAAREGAPPGDSPRTGPPPAGGPGHARPRPSWPPSVRGARSPLGNLDQGEAEARQGAYGRARPAGGVSRGAHPSNSSLRRGPCAARTAPVPHDSYLVDSASSHMLVSKIKPCMSKYKQLYSETANGSLYKLSFI